MNIDAFIQVRFRKPEEGGRKTPVKGEFYACPMFVDGKAYDCRLIINGSCLDLGETYEVPVIFLNRDLILPKLSAGKKIILWEGKDIADGVVTEICNRP